MAFHLRGTSNLLKRCAAGWLRKSISGSARTISSSQSRLSSDTAVNDSADTVIIGGGCVGAAIAYHLAKAGVKDVVLLEKSELTAGSTWHAAGLTTHYHPGDNVKRLQYYSVELYKTLAEETGQEIGLHLNGSIRVGNTPERMDEFKYQLTRQRWHEARASLVTPEEIAELHPLVDPNSILGGFYTPDDGYLDPYSLTQAYSAGARKYGAKVVLYTPVTGLTQTSDGGWDVATEKGTIRANRVVNSSGFWGREVGLMAGLDLPLVPVHHQYLVTKTVPELLELKKEPPVLRDVDRSFYLRPERTGLMIGPYEFQDKMIVCEDWYKNGPPVGFGKELFDLNIDRVYQHLEGSMEVCPVVQNADIQSEVCGPINYSPDGAPLLGPTREVRNFWQAVGVSYGIIQSGGIGKYLTEWMLNGEPPMDLIELDPDRFGNWTDEKYTIAKARESYGLNYAIVYPKNDYPAGRPTRRVSGIYEDLKAKGGVFSAHSGWEVAHWFAKPGDVPGHVHSFRRTNWFEPVGRECEMVMNRAGIIDLSTFGKIEIFGPDAAKFVDYICANNVPKLGYTNLSHMLTRGGKVCSELTVSHAEPGLFTCLTGSGSENHDLRWIEDQARIGNFDVTIKNITEEFAALGIAGPKSREILQKVTSEDLSGKAWPFMRNRGLKIGDVDTHAIRISYTGELGWEIYMKADQQKAVYDTIMAAGKEFGLGEFGSFAMNSMRMEKGFRSWGHEMTKDNDPYESGLGFFVKKNKAADFIGKESIKKISSEPLPKTLVFLNVDTIDVDPEGNETVWHGDKVVGYTTSGAYGYTVKKSLAFAYVPTELASPGNKFEVELLGERCPAEVQKGAPIQIEPVRNRAK